MLNIRFIRTSWFYFLFLAFIFVARGFRFRTRSFLSLLIVWSKNTDNSVSFSNRNWKFYFVFAGDSSPATLSSPTDAAFKSSSFEDRSFNQPRLASNHSDSNFEDLQNEMMRKYGFVGLNGAVSFDASLKTEKTEALNASLNNLAVAQRPQAGIHQPNVGNEPNGKRVGTPTKRSLSQASKPLDLNDIPPIVPPREPVRPARTSPPLRSCSTPSPTSCLLHHSTASSTHFSPSVSENFRSKYQFQPSTTAVFSALPSGLSSSHPVILPIMRDGKQESHTHYFLLGDDKVSLSSCHFYFWNFNLKMFVQNAW